MISKKIELFFIVASFTFVLTTLVGVFLYYSPVPHMDMWDGYLDFYIKVMDGDISKWFAQHNEHRTIFSNILFFIDIHFFNGYSIFLFVSNFILISLISFVLILVIRDLLTIDKNNIEQYRLKKILYAISIIFSFSWIQAENIIWGFQSQFFAAYLFPLFSFYFVIKSDFENKNIYFFYSLIFAIVSVGTMANGFLALPILFLLSILLKNNLYKILLIIISTIICIFLYFKGYVSPGGHGSISEILINNPLSFFQYLFAYLGGVFFYLTGKGSSIIAQIAGIFLVFTSFYFSYLVLIKKRNKFYYVSLAYLLYYGGTAFGTAGGRALFGLEQAFSSRYMTPSLIAWTLVVFLWVDYYKNNKIVIRRILISLVLVSLILLIYQVRIFKKYDNNYAIEQQVSVLALELGIKDESAIKKVFPFVDWVMDISKVPIERNTSIFGIDYIKDVSLMIGTKYLDDYESYESFRGKKGNIDFVKEDNKFIRLSGWLEDKKNNISKGLFVINEDNVIIGYVLSEFKNKENSLNGYKGYINYNLIKGKTTLVDKKLKKKFELNLYKNLLIN